MGEPHPTLKRDEIPFAVALGPSASSCSSSYRYKNNLRELIHIAINDCHPKNMEPPFMAIQMATSCWMRSRSSGSATG